MSAYKVLVFLENKISAFSIMARHIDKLCAELPYCDIIQCLDKEEFLSLLPSADFVITWVFNEEYYAIADCLKAVFTPAAGHDWVQADPSGKVKTFHGEYHGKIMRESLVSMILYFNRRLDISVERKKILKWDRDAYSSTHALSAQSVLIIGYGHIGKMCAEVLAPFGCRIVGVRRSIPPSGRDEYTDSILRFEDMDDALREADHVVMILPGGEDTLRIFTRKHFEIMKASAYLYNIGRGTCYAEEDLVWALSSGHIAAAGLDVFYDEPLKTDSPLWKMENCLITPHSSAICQEYFDYYLDEMIPRLNSVIDEIHDNGE